MKTLTHTKFISLLNSHKGAAIVGIEALTDAKAKKSGMVREWQGGDDFVEVKKINTHGAIFKHVRAVGFVGADYERSVQREGERQGATEAASFEAMSLPWGEWHLAGKVISHKGAFYLRTQSTPGQRNRQPARLLSYRNASGQFLSKEAVRPFLPAPSVSARQAAVGIGSDASAQVAVRTYAFASIRKVRVNGETFQLIAD